MRWEAPITLEKRIIKKFLIIPKEVNHEVRWLERVEIEQVYHRYTGWINLRWIDRRD